MIRALVLSLTLPTAAFAMEVPDPITDADYRATDPEIVALGRLLFWDPILSGNRTVSCGTCHHPDFGTGDGLSLGLGDGGLGLGPDRVVDADNPPEQRIPRNAPALWNLGAHEFTVLFHDGRIEETADGLRTPMGAEMEQGFATLLSAQTMFPVLSADEMAGHYGENEISRAVRQGIITGEGGAWDLLSARVRGIPAYAEMFEAAMPGRPIDFPAISDAIAQFMEAEWRSDTSPFDAWLRGEGDLHPNALRGVEVFYGAAGCADCHSGPFQTDHGFHAMGQPQLGPGKAARFERHARDEGRMRVTGAEADRFAFRTPSLRNVTVTGPWGHAGAYDNLRAFVRDHAAPRRALAAYGRDVVLPNLPVEDWRILDDPSEVTAIAAAIQGPDRVLSDRDVTALMAFLEALTDEAALLGRDGIPETVPSGLPVDR
ncbi:methylamine utilization protein MauG [Jannaschia pagri]|uniref:Methylamine utilization protein MauG n=1 Tax=Jannaschia pagri TaxID=2829797 RepID=A0ABQ4NM78_9RHOB|nr:MULTISPECIES: cytochrome c peroxidase [unclassified Jannaschia]GIT91659.1 methylamine utilization protein MauG [Jannaschia sp. AI_61]GIT95493.1 methylamine utilization protein MauG [Jannaschia sp. AI_62]